MKLRTCTTLVLLFLSLFALHSQSEKKLTVVTPSTAYSIPVTDVASREMIGIVDLLEPLGTITLKADGKQQQLTFMAQHGSNVSAQLQVGKSTIDLPDTKLQLDGKIALDKGRTLVPLHSAAVILNGIAGRSDRSLPQAVLHTQGRRLLMGDNYVQLQWTQSPPSLTLQFSTAAHPQVQAAGETLRITFPKDPVTGLPENDQSATRFIRSLNYTERDGDAELLVKGAAALSATVEDNGRKLVITPAAAATAAGATQTPPVAPPSAPATPAPTNGTTASSTPAPTTPAPQRVLVAIDAAHGGSDSGATLATDLIGQVEEKDFTLQLARRLRAELSDRGFAVVMVRDSDVALSAEAAAKTVNIAHPDLYVELHAVGVAAPMRAYIADLPPARNDGALFIPYSRAQQPWIAESATFANAVVTAFTARGNGDGSSDDDSGMKRAESRKAHLALLGMINCPAIAVEVAPESADTQLNSAPFQQRVARKLADAVAAAKLALLKQKPQERAR